MCGGHGNHSGSLCVEILCYQKCLPCVGLVRSGVGVGVGGCPKHILPVAQRFGCEYNACLFCVLATWMGGLSCLRCGLCLLMMSVSALRCACCVGSSRHTRTVSPHSPPRDSPWSNLAPFTPKIPLFTLVLAIRREQISGILGSTFNPLPPIDTPPS